MEKVFGICRDGFLGHFIGDAMGVPYEFLPREDRDIDPCTDMVGYGVHDMPPGTWSDDTSLTIAGIVGLIISLWNNENVPDNLEDMVDYEQVMLSFARWFTLNDFTPYGQAWGIGFATLDAITRYLNGATPLESGGVGERDNGNGSVMRLLPIILFVYFLSLNRDISLEEKMDIIHHYASLTHRHKRSQMACGIYAMITFELLDARWYGDDNRGIESIIYEGLTNAINYYYGYDGRNEEWDEELPHFKLLLSRNVQNLPREKIKSGGYVISTIEASIWCLCNNDNYRDTILEAVNLGYDTDTTACTVGALAGLYYGIENIPVNWINGLVQKDYLMNIVDSFSEELVKKMEE